MNRITDKYPIPAIFDDIKAQLSDIEARSLVAVNDDSVLEKIFNCIDLTSLNSTDSSFSITEMVEKVNQFEKLYPDINSVAALCVFPAFAPVLASALKVKGIKKAVVSAGFPASQTFTDIKTAETKKAIAFGANEVDIVISIGEFLEGNYEFVAEEIITIKEAMGNLHLKVIIESGALESNDNIWVASILSMESGADFIKTSTGKMSVGATPEAAFVMCHAIKAFHAKTGRKIGFKPAGGVATIQDALLYYQIVNDVLGQEWLNNELFRVGASRLANALLTRILELRKGITGPVNFF